MPTRRRRRRRTGGVRPAATVAQPITINPHQVAAVHKLVTSGQKGLLLWHMMGTGKTLTALTFALNCPARRVVVFCPQELTYVWKAEIARVPALDNAFAFYAYERGAEFFAQESLADDVLILDEAQHLVAQLRGGAGVHAKIELLKTAHKVLALSGTPIYADEHDLSFLVNVCAGKEVVPYNEFAFRRRYYKVDRAKSVVFGYFKPYMNRVNSIVFTMSMVLQGMQMAYNYGGGDEVDKGGFAKALLASMGARAKALEKAVAALNVNTLVGALVARVDTGGAAAALFEKTTAAARARITAELTAIAVKKGVRGKVSGMVIEHLGNVPVMLAMCVLPMAASAMLTRVVGTVQMFKDFRSFDAHAFADDTAPYISYHKNRPGEDPAFPAETYAVRNVSYSLFQLDKWMQLTQGYLTEALVRDVDLAPATDAEYYAEKVSFAQYMLKGCAIGNLAPAGDHSPKFRAVLKAAKGRRAVFYSGFAEKGVLALAAFLDAEGVPYAYMDKGLSDAAKGAMLEAFAAAHETGAQSFLLLHPCYSEGVSVRGAEQLHLIDPIWPPAKRAQAVARVARYMSHAHLPLDEHTVEVVQWVCTASDVILSLAREALVVAKWLQSATEVELAGDHVKFPRNWGTPDQVLANSYNIQTRVAKDITGAVKSIPAKDIDCCVRYPSAAQEEACMRRTKRRCQ